MKSENSLIGISLIGSICTISVTFYNYILSPIDSYESITFGLLLMTIICLTYLFLYNRNKKKRLGFLWDIERGDNGGLTYNKKRHALFRVKTFRNVLAGVETNQLRKIAFEIGFEFSNDLINGSISEFTQNGIKNKIQKWLKFDSMMGFGIISYEGDPSEIDTDWGVVNVRFSFIEHDQSKQEKVIAFYEGYFEGVLFGLTNIRVQVTNDPNYRLNISDCYRYRVTNN